jgi:hypothetical protein
MGEIADAMLEGLLDEETGEYIGDRNLAKYGLEAPGFPISYERKDRGVALKDKIACPVCNKQVSAIGLAQHRRDKRH